MKRISELEAEAKRARQEADKEIARIKAEESFIPLLNTALAAWKVKLNAKATVEKKDWKLIIYSHEDNSPLHYGRSNYDPYIFSDKEWLVQDWSRVRGRTGEGVVVAYADNPENLLPDDDALRLLGCFRLPFAVMPSWLEQQRKMDYSDWDAKLEHYHYGLSCEWYIDDPATELSSTAGIENPDPTNPEHIKAIYASNWKPAVMSPDFAVELEELDKKRKSLLRQMEYYQVAVNLKNKLLCNRSITVICRGRSWIMNALFTKIPTFAELYSYVESQWTKRQWKFYADCDHQVEITNDADLLKCQTSSDLANLVMTVWVKSVI